MKTQYDVCVVGGGAAGMAAAIAAAEGGNTVCIIDKNKKLGKKLYATGNGRCNLANTDMKDGHYHSSSETYQKFLHTCLGEQPLHEMFAFLHSIGVYTRCIDGYYYPISMQLIVMTIMPGWKSGAMEAGIFWEPVSRRRS